VHRFAQLPVLKVAQATTMARARPGMLRDVPNAGTRCSPRVRILATDRYDDLLNHSAIEDAKGTLVKSRGTAPAD